MRTIDLFITVHDYNFGDELKLAFFLVKIYLKNETKKETEKLRQAKSLANDKKNKKSGKKLVCLCSRRSSTIFVRAPALSRSNGANKPESLQNSATATDY